MTRQLLIRPRAKLQARGALEFWGALFDREYQAALQQLLVTPRMGPPCPTARHLELRHLLLRGCQIYLYYLYDPAQERVIIVALWSTRRGSPPPL